MTAYTQQLGLALSACYKLQQQSWTSMRTAWYTFGCLINNIIVNISPETLDVSVNAKKMAPAHSTELIQGPFAVKQAVQSVGLILELLQTTELPTDTQRLDKSTVQDPE